MKITLVRHGQTEENFLRKVQGLENHLLNDSGRRECQALRKKLDKKHFDVCYMSPLVRCVETAFILVGDVCEMIPDKRLIDRNMGEMEGRPLAMYNAYQFWNYSLNRSDFGIEAVQDIFKRCEDFLDYIAVKYPNQNILVVTHSAVYRALRYLLKQEPLKGPLLDGNISNCQYEEFVLEHWKDKDI